MPSSARSRSSKPTSSSASAGGSSPFLDDLLYRAQAVGEGGGPGLQDDGGLDLAHETTADRRDVAPARARRHLLRLEFLAAPGTEDDVGRAPRHLLRVGDDPLPAEGLNRQLGKTVFAACDADQLGDPADARDQRLVPFLEIHARAARQGARALARRLDPLLETSDELRRAVLATDHAAQRADHAQDLRDTALVEEVHFQ